ncbi:MAG: hypothetical protein FJ146_19510 [Deltaproteobacteria bacterium]|nr:hypothetical protein [Deltaproteobacteria bacterium]
MKFFRSLPPMIFLAALVSGCATLNEPSDHLAACHTADGLLINTPDCIEAHNVIMLERQQRTARMFDNPIMR